MSEFILFFVSALPVVLLGLYIYNKDKDKEPLKLITKLFLGGIFSCVLVLIITWTLGIFFPIVFADYKNLNLFQLIVHAFIVVALVEEFSKWIMAYAISYNNHEFGEIYDMIVYCVFVALGFAFFENLFYVYQNGVGTGIIRAILTVPGHAFYGVFMGYYLGLAKLSSINGRKDLKNRNLLLSILVPVLLHGIFDFCLFTQSLIFIGIFFIFIIMLYIFAIKKIKRISSINVTIKYNDKYCSNCGHIVNSNYCPICGRKNK